MPCENCEVQCGAKWCPILGVFEPNDVMVEVCRARRASVKKDIGEDPEEELP